MSWPCNPLATFSIEEVKDSGSFIDILAIDTLYFTLKSASRLVPKHPVVAAGRKQQAVIKGNLHIDINGS